MSELIVQIAQLEERLLGTWTRRPSLRAAWTPDPSEFFSVRCQAVAAACRAVADMSGNDLSIAVVAALSSAGKLRLWDVGAPVVDHQDEADPMAALDRCRELRALAALHGTLAHELAGIGTSTDLGELRARILEAIRASEACSAVRAYSDADLMGVALEAVTVNRIAGYSTGFRHLDEVTGGLRPGHVWTIGAPTNWGKSSWLLALLDHCQRVCGRRALLVTAEDAPELLGTRLLCRRAGLPGRAARDGRLTVEHLARAENEIIAARARAAGPVLIDGRGRDVEHLAGDIRAATRAHGVELVLVDYLQAIGTSRRTQDRRAEINHIARTLTDAIKTSGAAGVLASQLTGEDIRESRDVEHAAEVVLIGRREPDPPHALKLFIKKNKVGAKDAVIDLQWDNLNGSFRTGAPVNCGDQRWDSPSDPRPEEGMTSPQRDLRMPPADLIEDLIVRRDACFGDTERLVCRAQPRHLRLYVAGWMLWSGEDSRDARVAALREAHQLYTWSGRGLLDQPRRLTTADIVCEVLQLLAANHGPVSERNTWEPAHGPGAVT